MGRKKRKARRKDSDYMWRDGYSTLLNKYTLSGCGRWAINIICPGNSGCVACLECVVEQNVNCCTEHCPFCSQHHKPKVVKKTTDNPAQLEPLP